MDGTWFACFFTTNFSFTCSSCSVFATTTLSSTQQFFGTLFVFCGSVLVRIFATSGERVQFHMYIRCWRIGKLISWHWIVRANGVTKAKYPNSIRFVDEWTKYLLRKSSRVKCCFVHRFVDKKKKIQKKNKNWEKVFFWSKFYPKNRNKRNQTSVKETENNKIVGCKIMFGTSYRKTREKKQN